MKKFLFILTILAIAVVSIALGRAAQHEINQAKILDAIGFDQVVLTTLIALEQNYKVKERLLPKVHKDDYYTVVLNTAKRISLVAAQRPVSTVLPDTTNASN